MSNILGEINTFFERSPAKALEITFAQLKIDTYHNGQFLQQIQRPNCKIVLQKVVNNALAKMDVVDNLVFRFSFWFEKPTTENYFKGETLQLPRPLAEGTLQMDAEKLTLQFTIDAPDKNLQVHVRHIYTEIQRLETKKPAQKELA
ncbi:hypothetical protein [Flagellimonas sp.]|uniref:hypothetical protein n=1 Tax=Flagellimonas sp. TaxID=2058762 RepID=UPI003B5B01B8